MRLLLTIALLTSCLSLSAAEMILPESLNSVMGKIHAGIKKEEAKAILVATFPGTVEDFGMWGGRVGFIDFVLDTRYVLRISFTTNAQEEMVVGDEVVFQVRDRVLKQIFEIQVKPWIEKSIEAPKKKG